MQKKGICIISHGSRSSQTKREVDLLVDSLRKKIPNLIIEGAYLELEDPNINEGIDLCIQKGAKEVLVLLNFLNAGRHVDCDIPEIVEHSRKKHPKIAISISEPVGQHPGIQHLFLDLISNNPTFTKPQHLDFSKNLLKWYRKNKRDLPWRKTKDPYAIWVSEIMLQQTTVATVIPKFQQWMKKFPTIKKLAAAKEQTVLNQWQGLGYYNRAKNLHKAAKIIADEYKGRLPSEPTLLKKLPGFGPYTVGSVSSIAFEKREPIIDTNVRRVIMRQMALRGKADDSQNEQIYDFLERSMPHKNIGDFNQSMMELGATVCRSKEPICNQCPIKGGCKAFLGGIQEIIPETQKKAIKEVNAVIGIITYKGKYFIQQRPKTGLLANMWEFPGGKIELGEKPSEALKRELFEELNIDVIDQKFLFKVRHYYTQFKVNLSVWSAIIKGKPATKLNNTWVSLKGMDKYPMPSGSAKIVERLKTLDKEH